MSTHTPVQIALLLIVAAGIANAQQSRPETLAFADTYLSALTAKDLQAELVYRTSDSEKLAGWKRFFTPTLALLNEATLRERVIIRVEDLNDNIGLYIFTLPGAPRETVREFHRIVMDGFLISKAHTSYYLVANKHVIAVLTLEQKLLDASMPAAQCLEETVRNWTPKKTGD